MDLDHFNNDEKSSLSRSIMKKEKLMIDVTQMRQIINLDCSLGPTDSRMTSRVCKKDLDRKKTRNLSTEELV
jgi:hypothetical protein